MSFFLANKNFHSRMSFSSNPIIYDIKREQLLAEKAEDITNGMQKTLKVITTKFKLAKEAMTEQANKHRREINFKAGDCVKVSTRT